MKDDLQPESEKEYIRIAFEQLFEKHFGARKLGNLSASWQTTNKSASSSNQRIQNKRVPQNFHKLNDLHSRIVENACSIASDGCLSQKTSLVTHPITPSLHLPYIKEMDQFSRITNNSPGNEFGEVTNHSHTLIMNRFGSLHDALLRKNPTILTTPIEVEENSTTDLTSSLDDFFTHYSLYFSDKTRIKPIGITTSLKKVKVQYYNVSPQNQTVKTKTSSKKLKRKLEEVPHIQNRKIKPTPTPISIPALPSCHHTSHSTNSPSPSLSDLSAIEYKFDTFLRSIGVYDVLQSKPVIPQDGSVPNVENHFSLMKTFQPTIQRILRASNENNMKLHRYAEQLIPPRPPITHSDSLFLANITSSTSANYQHHDEPWLETDLRVLPSSLCIDIPDFDRQILNES